jgi:hypothetical protein
VYSAQSRRKSSPPIRPGPNPASKIDKTSATPAKTDTGSSSAVNTTLSNVTSRVSSAPDSTYDSTSEDSDQQRHGNHEGHIAAKNIAQNTKKGAMRSNKPSILPRISNGNGQSPYTYAYESLNGGGPLQNGWRTIWAWRKLLLGGSLLMIVLWMVFGGSSSSWHSEGMSFHLIQDSDIGQNCTWDAKHVVSPPILLFQWPEANLNAAE